MEPEHNLSRSGDEYAKWDPGQRNIHVATPAILEALKHVFGATRIVDELRKSK